MWTSTSTPVTPVSRSHTPTSFCGTSRRQTKPRSPSSRREAVVILSRRGVLLAAGGTAAALLVARIGRAADVEVRMAGRPDGSNVWFDPIGIHVMPGTTIRWRNVDAGNSHTATAYHP